MNTLFERVNRIGRGFFSTDAVRSLTTSYGIIWVLAAFTCYWTLGLQRENIGLILKARLYYSIQSESCGGGLSEKEACKLDVADPVWSNEHCSPRPLGNSATNHTQGSSMDAKYTELANRIGLGQSERIPKLFAIIADPAEAELLLALPGNAPQVAEKLGRSEKTWLRCSIRCSSRELRFLPGKQIHRLTACLATWCSSTTHPFCGRKLLRNSWISGKTSWKWNGLMWPDCTIR